MTDAAPWSNVQFDFTGRHVLITGGTSGIGAGIAQAYRAAGAHVAITGTRKSAADYDVDLSGYDYHQLDVTDSEAVTAFAASRQQVDILVNNAGMAGSAGAWGNGNMTPKSSTKRCACI